MLIIVLLQHLFKCKALALQRFAFGLLRLFFKYKNLMVSFHTSSAAEKKPVSFEHLWPPGSELL